MDRILSASAIVLALIAGVLAFVLAERRGTDVIAMKDQIATLQKQVTDTQSALKATQERIAPVLAALESALPPPIDMSKLTDEANAAFLAEFEKRPGVVKTASGLMYRQIQPGKEGGATPKPGDVVTVDYEGAFIDGTIFDATARQGGPASFPLNGLIPAWMEALPLMKEGEAWEIAAPYQLGYGEEGRATIPPKQTLVFKVQLLKVEPAKAENAPQ